jgi:hypothetical protein
MVFDLDDFKPAKHISITVEDFIKRCFNIDINPVHQRMPVVNTVEQNVKYQSIIASMIRGVEIGQITLNMISNHIDLGKRYAFESIDGGHRKRAIVGYVTGLFPLGYHLGPKYEGKYFSQLTEEEQKHILNIVLSFVIYTDCESSTIADIFQSINTCDPVNHQEMMNAYGNIGIANLIRELARMMGGEINNVCHKLFEETKNMSGERIGIYMSRPNTRLSYDRLVARVVCICVNNGKISGCDDVDIVDMYNREYSSAEIDNIRKMAIACLNFIFDCAIGKRGHMKNGAKITTDEFIMLMRLYFTYENRYPKGWKIDNFEKFFEEFAVAFTENTFEGSSCAKNTVAFRGNTELRYKAFGKALKKHSGSDNWMFTISNLEERASMDPEYLMLKNILIVKSSRRVSRSVRNASFILQRGIDPFTGEKMTMDEAQLDHKVAHSKGGNSELDNLIWMLTEHNQEKGSMNYESYAAVMALKEQENV